MSFEDSTHHLTEVDFDLEMGASPICSCGRTHGLPMMIPGVPDAVWKYFRPFATRAAVSPLFAPSHLECVGAATKDAGAGHAKMTEPQAGTLFDAGRSARTGVHSANSKTKKPDLGPQISTADSTPSLIDQDDSIVIACNPSTGNASDKFVEGMLGGAPFTVGVEDTIIDHRNCLGSEGPKEAGGMSDTCWACGHPGKPKLLQCSRCKTVKYCSAECSKSDWKAHKPVCRTR
jgi:hypothetical protein